MQHVRFEHRVVRDAAHRDAGARQHVDVVLRVLAELAPLRVLENRPQHCEHGFARQLRRRAGIVVTERDVAGRFRLHRERQADDLGAHRIERGRLAVEGDQLRVAQFRGPRVEPFRRGDEFVVAGSGERAVDGFRFAAVIAANAGTRVAFRPRVRRLSRPRRRRRGSAGCLQLLQRRVELVALVQPAQRIDVALAQVQVGRPAFEFDVGLDRRQLARQRQLRQRLAQVLADLAADFFRRRDHAVEAAVLGQPLRRGLRPALLHTGNVVDAVAHQREVVDDLVRPHAELLHHRGGVERGVGHRVDEFDAGLDQLREILVAGRHRHVDACGDGALGQRADHVVGLDAVDAQDRKTERGDDRHHRLDLRDQVFRRGLPRRLVGGIQRVAEGRPRRVLHEGGVGGLLLQDRAQHVDHAEQRAGRFAGRVRQRRQRVERAIQIRGAVDEDEARAWFGHDGTQRQRARSLARARRLCNAAALSSLAAAD